MDPDQAPTCGSWVEITEADLRGPFRMALTEAEHPAHRDHPDVKVAVCALDVGHDGLCEMFVDGDGTVFFWLTWERPDPVGDHAVTYTWIKAESMCDEPHPDADYFLCARPVDHRHGHGMWGEV